MTKFQKWLITSPKAAFFLFTIPYCVALITLTILAEFPLWPAILISLLFAFAIYVIIDNMPARVLKKSAYINNFQCDPYPLLEQCDQLLAMKLRPAAHLSISINRAAALGNIGNTKEGDQTLSALDIGISAYPFTQFSYYAGLASVALCFEREEQVNFCLGQLERIYERIKIEAEKKEAYESLLMIRAQSLLSQGKAEDALNFLSKLQTTLPIRLVGRALHQGKAYMALENWDLAEMWLNQVVQTGNRLYAVEEAKALLAEIQAKRTDLQNS